MGYYVRVLTKSKKHLPIIDLIRRLEDSQYRFKLELDDGDENQWTQFTLFHDDDTPICVVERNEVEKGNLSGDEISEFLEEIEGCKPVKAVKWLSKYLKEVNVIFAFQLLSGTDKDNGWDIFGTLKTEVWRMAGGIIQADAEGFSNEDGYHILWQFNDDAEGDWCMAVLDFFGNWKKFKMDLGNMEHRDAFFAGKIPKGAIVL